MLGLGKHYDRAEIQASVADDGSIDITLAKNITALAIHPPMLQGQGSKLRIEGAEVELPEPRAGVAGHSFAFAREGDKWRFLGVREGLQLTGKRPGVQGPIDDAFTAPFLCVRGTGKPWNAAVGAWADASLRRFQYEFARYMRGDVLAKNDTDVTEDDVRSRNLILFGDPGSNIWINKALPHLPMTWDQEKLTLGGKTYSVTQHAPALICANPLEGAGDHYIVINSGHTFHEKEFADKNYLLFPRLGDWAVMKVGDAAEKWEPGGAVFPEEAVIAGYFDEKWK